MSMELKSYLSRKFEGRESFLENIVFPIFGEDRFEDMYDVDALDNEDLQAMARRTGIKSAILYGLVQIGTTEINIYDVTVSDRVMMRRNRVGIQQLIRRIMLDYTSAFIIFHYEDSDSWDWRFSFCQKDNKEVTEAKRYTFLLGPGQSCRTAAQNFQKLIDKHGDINRDDIVAAFDVEALSKEFFDKYKAKYEKFCNYIYDNRSDESLFGREFAEWDEKLIRDYVKKLLGRIVFLHFLQKKGWLGVSVDKQWGEGDNQFMRNLFKASTQEQKDNYLDSVLEPLFADALNTQRPNDIFDLNVEGFRSTKIPYLNGGLFERDALDEPKSTFPASYFEDLFEFFYQYNFTIDENDPNDAEVGIDPEMLGHIFENLLEDNKDKGAFYTPKEIVQYMCRESLIAYLTTCVMKKQGENHKPEEEIKESVRQLLNKPENIVPRMKKEHLDDFGSYIRNVKICDPAIGSGAFPMGLLNELVRCRVFINAWAKDDKGNLLEGDYAALKTEIISNNIYGVDIEKGAIDIARLRFWLSIIVDEQTPHVLPNFDYKFMQGNSLIPTFDGKFINLDTKTQKHINVEAMKKEKQRLYEIKQKYYTAEGEEKQGLNIQIKDTILKLVSRQLGYESRAWYQHNAVEGTLPFNDVETMSFDEVRQSLPEEKLKSIALAESLHSKLNNKAIPVDERSQIDIHFFDWRIMFTEVFDNGNEGFDIVIGNPPYIDSESMTNQGMGNLRELLKKRFDCLEGNWDVYMAFLEFSLSISSIVVFITPDKWLSKPFGKKFRKTRMRERMSLITKAGSKVFENATVDAIITLYKKESDKLSVNEFESRDNSVLITSKGCYSIKELQDPFIIDFLFADNIGVICKMDKFDGKFQQLAECEGACATSDAYKLKPLVRNCINPNYDEDFIIINTGTISKYYYRWGISPMKYLGDSYLNPIVKKTDFISTFGSTYIRRAMRPKIIFKGLNLLDVCLDEYGWICPAKSTNVICSEDISLLKYLCGLLNSKLMFYYIKIKYSSSSYCGGITFTKDMINSLPINVSADRNAIVCCADKILKIKNENPHSDTSALEREIDQLVYQLYGLTDEEISIVEGKDE